MRLGSKFVLAGSIRYDDWTNARAYSSTRTVATNQTTTINFPDRNETAFSPQISALYQVTEKLSIFTVFSKSFRAPTLNELYRGFRVGNVVTLADTACGYACRLLLPEGASGFTTIELKSNFLSSARVGPASAAVE